MKLNQDHYPFLRAVIADPDDDLPRLVFADWLDEHRDPAWASMIRRGCEHPKKVLYADNVPHLTRDRSRNGLQSVWSTIPSKTRTPGATGVINRVIPSPRNTHRFNALFARGFLKTVECPWDWFADHAGELLATHPLAEVRLVTWPPLIVERVDNRTTHYQLGKERTPDGIVLGAPGRPWAVRELLKNEFGRHLTFLLPGREWEEVGTTSPWPTPTG